MSTDFGTTCELTDVWLAVERALPTVREHREDIQARGRLPDVVVSALRESGINRLALPAALGRLEAPVSDGVRIIEQIAAADGSAGWCAVIGAGSNIFAGYLPEAGAREVSPTPTRANPPTLVGACLDDLERARDTGVEIERSAETLVVDTVRMARLADIVIDCAHPAALARFWAASLDDYAVAPYDDEELERLRSIGIDDPEDDPSVLVVATPDRPRLWFQRVPETKQSKNRVHLDLRADDLEREVSRLTALGATVLSDQPTADLIVMRDPEGNEFCVLAN